MDNLRFCALFCFLIFNCLMWNILSYPSSSDKRAQKSIALSSLSIIGALFLSEKQGSVNLFIYF